MSSTYTDIPMGDSIEPGSAETLIPEWSTRRTLLLLLWVHLLLVLHFAPPGAVLSGEPPFAVDYPLHYYQTDRAVQSFEGFGRLWGWDPLVLAGHPVGALEDLGNKTVEIFVITLTRLGCEQALAFNLFIVLVHLLVPFAAWATGILFQLGDRETLIVVASWILLWFFDSFFHWLWHCGMISWALTVTLAPVFAGLFFRTIECLRIEPTGTWIRFAAPAALLAAFLALTHPFAALPAGLPALWIYLRDRKSIGPAGHWFFAGTVTIAAAATTVWLVPAVGWVHYLLPVDTFLRPNPFYLLSDFLDLNFDHEQTGMPVRTLLRLLVLSLGAYGFSLMHRARDRRFGPLIISCVTLFGIAYLGGLLPLLRESQPYRQIAPAVLYATLPAALALPGLFDRRIWAAAPRRIRILAVVALVMVVPQFVRTVIFYFPEPLPGYASFENTGMPMPLPMKLHNPPPEAHTVREFLEKALPERPGRVVVEDYPLSEYLAATSDLPILGGIPQRPIPHADAHLFRLDEEGNLPPEQLAAYFERYAVRFIVIRNIRRQLERSYQALTLVRTEGPFRIYEANAQPSYFMRGEGRIAGQKFNSIEVDSARGDPETGDLVLRFHWAETLACSPDCRVEREEVPGARVGFIRIVDPPPSFEITNSYRRLHPRWEGERRALPDL